MQDKAGESGESGESPLILNSFTKAEPAGCKGKEFGIHERTRGRKGGGGENDGREGKWTGEISVKYLLFSRAHFNVRLLSPNNGPNGFFLPGPFPLFKCLHIMYMP